jgi:hypothetical protein
VDIVDDKVVPRGLEHGLGWTWVEAEDVSRLRLTCSTCWYDVTTESSALVDYLALRDELTEAIAAGHTEHKVGFFTPEP